jgi:hypothetical protein
VRRVPARQAQAAPVVHAVPADREHYALLWGTSSAGRRQIELVELKRRAALVALVGSFVLALIMLTNALG